MASSESENSFLEQLINSRNRDLSILFPLILGIMGGRAAATTDEEEEEEEDDDAAQADDHRETTDRIIFINPFTQGMIVLEAGRSLEALLRELADSGNKGPPPASKGSIDEMPRVRVEVAEECSICLEEMVGEAREMPCKHRYHSNCIEMWLGLHGSCPVCRYRMPLEEEDEGNKAGEGGGRVYADEEGGGGRRRRRRRREIWVTFSVNRRSNSSSFSSSSTTDHSSSSSSSSSSDFDEN
ncbi:zinc finger protein [Cinnamomum micranthum f. kanehirae]|uniref:RING-type E3 ubiquitin transferase n=1 Tax=Cinnamomum micranthum f. kanehirae TaxID=337451 RepID=A0A3S3N226_9MAGN|nr:zinc finger protein [Cinnamomum micranthum f. kanehirae]